MELLSILLSGGLEFLGTPIFDSEDFWKMVTKTIFNLIIITVIDFRPFPYRDGKIDMDEWIEIVKKLTLFNYLQFMLHFLYYILLPKLRLWEERK